jgi:hypothetical protein
MWRATNAAIVILYSYESYGNSGCLIYFIFIDLTQPSTVFDIATSIGIPVNQQ